MRRFWGLSEGCLLQGGRGENFGRVKFWCFVHSYRKFRHSRVAQNFVGKISAPISKPKFSPRKFPPPKSPPPPLYERRLV